MGKLLTIETGFTCNSRCHYCTQLDYRVIPQADQLDLDTGQIRDRIVWAAEHGYDQLGFSGGEPTIRPDFIELVEPKGGDVAGRVKRGFDRAAPSGGRGGGHQMLEPVLHPLHG